MSIFTTIKKSIMDAGGRESSTRISAYLLTAIILLYSLTFIGIELTNAFSIWLSEGTEVYKISNEVIVVFGSMLSHHLAVLFNKRKENVVEKEKEMDI